MTDVPATITVSRASLSLPDLVFSMAYDGTPLGILSYQAPALLWRRNYMPDSVDTHGSELVSAAYQQAILGWDWIRDNGATEAQVQASRKEVEQALAQFSYTVTTQVNGAPAEAWSAEPGDQTPSARTYEDLANSNPVFSVSVPVYPIAS